MDKEIARLVQNLYLSGPFSPLSLVHFLDTYLDMPSIQGISGLSEIGEIGVQELFGAVVWSRTPIWGCRHRRREAAERQHSHSDRGASITNTVRLYSYQGYNVNSLTLLQ